MDLPFKRPLCIILRMLRHLQARRRPSRHHRLTLPAAASGIRQPPASAPFATAARPGPRAGFSSPVGAIVPTRPHVPNPRPLHAPRNPAAIPAGAAGLHVHADDGAHREGRQGPARQGRRGHRSSSGCSSCWCPQALADHHPDGVPAGLARGLRPPLRRQRMGRHAGLRRHPASDAPAGHGPGRRLLGRHLVGHDRSGPRRQPGVPGDRLPGHRGQGRERDQAQDLLHRLPQPRPVPDGHGARRRLVRRLRRRHQPARAAARLASPEAAGWSSTRRKRQVEMVLEDRVTYRMGTDAKGRAEFEQSASRWAIRKLDPEQVFPKNMPIKGEPEKTHRRASPDDRRAARRPTSRPTGPSTTSISSSRSRSPAWCSP